MTPVLVTLTACTCAGKSYLFNYIRDSAKLPCLISTTTRSPRAGEVDGVDYFFISEEESIRLEDEDQLAELAIYNGARYGVTKQEFHSKLSTGLAFLIVEPSGIDHYVKPALDVGAKHWKVWVDVPEDIRLERFAQRAIADIRNSTIGKPDALGHSNGMEKSIRTVLKRHEAMLNAEKQWKDSVEWNQTVSGLNDPKHNLQWILLNVEMICRNSNKPIQK
jgi:guanylate kinase